MRARDRISAMCIGALLATAIVGAVPASAFQPAPPPARVAAPSGSASRSPVHAVERLLNGIPESGEELGYANAPVTLQIFGDLECPVCRAIALGALPGLIRHDVRTRELKIEARSLETATREPEVFGDQQVAALAAGRQDRLWYFNEIFYREQGPEGSGYVTDAYLRGIAQQVPGLRLPAWSAARRDPLLAAQVARDERAALLRGFNGTPSYLIGRTGRRLRPFEPGSLEDPSPFEAAVDRLLKRRR
jgi:protein-disulfide isomerase